MIGGQGGEGVDQEIAALLGVDAAQKQEIAAVAEGGQFCAERGFLFGRVPADVVAAERRDPLAQAIGPEGVAGGLALDLRGEHDGSGVVQERPLVEEPERLLREGFYRIGFPEPGIEHAMGEDDIGRLAARQGFAGGHRGIVPETVDDDDVVMGHVRFQPLREFGRMPVAHPRQLPPPTGHARSGLAEGEGRDRAGGDTFGVRGVERGDVRGKKLRRTVRRLLQDRGDRTAAARIDGADDVQDPHRRLS